MEHYEILKVNLRANTFLLVLSEKQQIHSKLANGIKSHNQHHQDRE